MKKKPLLIIAALLLLAVPCLSDDGESVELKEVTRALESPFKTGQDSTIRDFKADFSQESRITSLDRVQPGSGRVAVKLDPASTDRRLTMFRWDYEQPVEQEIVSNGKMIWVHLPENRQVIKSEIDTTSPASADDPITFLTGLGNLSRDFSIGWAEPKKDDHGNYVLELRPRRSSAMIQRLLIVVDRKALSGQDAGSDDTASGNEAVFPIVSTMVFDPNGNSTTIEFSDVRTNLDIPDSLFEFSIPDGVEVVNPEDSQMGL